MLEIAYRHKTIPSTPMQLSKMLASHFSAISNLKLQLAFRETTFTGKKKIEHTFRTAFGSSKTDAGVDFELPRSAFMSLLYSITNSHLHHQNMGLEHQCISR